MKINEVDNRINECINILNKARAYFSRCKSLLSTDLSDEEKELVKRIQIIKDSAHSFWVITILELCKLIDESHNHKHNLFSLMKLINNNWKELNMSERMDIPEFREIEHMLYNMNISEKILSIKTLRDKYYAHTDIDNPDPRTEVASSFEKIEPLINGLMEILIALKAKVMKTSYIFHSVFQSDYIMLSDLLIGVKSNKRFGFE